MSEWISVEDGLPRGIDIPGEVKRRDEFYVLAVDAKNRMSIGYLFYGSWTFAKPIGMPTHWMRLPAPPERNLTTDHKD